MKYSYIKYNFIEYIYIIINKMKNADVKLGKLIFNEWFTCAQVSRFLFNKFILYDTKVNNFSI